MSKDKQIDVLYQMMNNQNTTYAWTVGIFVAIILALFGVFSYFQWKLNSNQMKKIIDESVKAVDDKYGVANNRDLMDKLCETYLQKYVNDNSMIMVQRNSNPFILDLELTRLQSMIELVYEGCKYSYQIGNLITIFYEMLGIVFNDDRSEDMHIKKLVYDIDKTLKNNWASDYMEHTNYENIKYFLSSLPKETEKDDKQKDDKQKDNKETPKS